MFAEVILHRRVPSKFESFTYAVPKDMRLKRGQMVKVPFKQQKISGIVRQLHENAPRFPTRELLEAGALFLENWQMELAESLSREHSSSLGTAVNLFIPEKIWKNFKDEEKKFEFHIPQTTRAPSAAIKKIIQSCLASPKPKLVLEKSRLPRSEFFFELASHASNGQILILFPEVFALKKLGGAFPLYHGELKEKEKAEIWHAARAGTLPVLAGTRAALFLPSKDLRCIVLDSEENESYQEKRQPAYFAPEVAQRIASMKKIPLISLSAAPRVETWHKILNNEYEKIEFRENLPDAEPAAPGALDDRNITVIDMKDERRKGNVGIFAEHTIEQIAACLGQDKQILLFVNRKGEGSALFCMDCRGIARCPSCSEAFTVHRGGALLCRRCKTTRETPTSCISCRGTRLKTIGEGTEKLESEIKKIFGRARVLRLDRETVLRAHGASAKPRENLALPVQTEAELKHKVQFDEKNLAAADIIVATKIIEKPIDLKRLALTVTVATDGLLAGQDFRASERAWQLLTHLKLLTQDNLIIQTQMPEHKLFQLFAQQKLEEFYAGELMTRKSLSLPPFQGP